MEPVTTAVTAYLAKDGIGKLLGPTADYLGEGLRDLTRRRVESIGRIFSNASTKLGSQLDEPGQVPPRVLKTVLNEGSYCEDPVALEYFGGVLASSRTERGRDDRGARVAKVVDNLSTYQLRTHYLIYSSIANLFATSGRRFGTDQDRTQMQIFLPGEGYANAMEFSQEEWNNPQMLTAVPLGPYENGPGTPCAGMMGLVKPTENTGGTKPVAHNDTVFAQVLKLVPRHEFESLARKHKSGRMSRSMTRWGQFVAMGMAQLTGRCSLRDIVSNLAAQSCKLYHLGVGVVTRSSLARVNAEKPWEMYEELHGRLLGRCQAKAPGHGYRFKAKLFSVDSTTIDLCLSAFPWAKFRRTKGAVKVHVGLDHEGYLPTFVRVTNGKTSDIEAARALTLPKGSIVAADRAYVDFAWIDSLISEGIHLVTRLKRGIKYGVVETREVNAKRGVTSDETIEFTSAKGRKQCPHRLRRIGYHDRKTGKDYVFLTTHFHLSAKTIADIYKSRWQVELFFKWIKQNLKVKSFVGTSRNAVMTQVWTAMCIYLILSYIKFANRIAWRLSEILRLLQLNLFERRPLRELLGSGNESPPDRSSQLTMKFTWT